MIEGRPITDRRPKGLDDDFYPQKLIRGVEHMSGLVLAQLKRVLDAYASRDLQAALAVWNGDEEIDAMCVSLFRELLTYMMEDPRDITFCHAFDVLRQGHRTHGRPCPCRQGARTVAAAITANPATA
jgi:phosphate uptake regulator